MGDAFSDTARDDRPLPTLHVLSSRPHYLEHIRPVLNELRVPYVIHESHASLPRTGKVLVASITDHQYAKSHRETALMEHGAGQSYGGADQVARDNPSYAGGAAREGVSLFLHPNGDSARRDWERYPWARVEVVGSPRLDTLPARKWDGVTTVAVSFHWDCRVSQESASAFLDFKDSLGQLGRWRVIGHGHPRMMDHLRPWYQTRGIEVIEDFDEVCRRADLYVCDNSSTLFEFASTGRPVVVLNAGLYRKSVHHGLRFWDAANVGIQVDDPAMLGLAAEYALSDPTTQRDAREAALSIAYTYRTGAAARAARVLEDWLT